MQTSYKHNFLISSWIDLIPQPRFCFLAWLKPMVEWVFALAVRKGVFHRGLGSAPEFPIAWLSLHACFAKINTRIHLAYFVLIFVYHQSLQVLLNVIKCLCPFELLCWHTSSWQACLHSSTFVNRIAHGNSRYWSVNANSITFGVGEMTRRMVKLGTSKHESTVALFSSLLEAEHETILCNRWIHNLLWKSPTTVLSLLQHLKLA